jgi:preprotein translocase subunit Sec63
VFIDALVSLVAALTDEEAFEKNYEILGLPTFASDADVKKKYKELALKMYACIKYLYPVSPNPIGFCC